MIIGTAGHIDHGKTTLIRSLTGIDTDRLKEEKKRGITIELGFAHLDLEGIERIGIVDVPGHEKFVKHMVAGITAVDFVLFVVAADEGMMPQSYEHLMILSDLGIDRGVFLLTKADTVDEELIELVRMQVEEAKEGTSLADAPILAVDSLSGRGLDELKHMIRERVDAADRSSGPFRLHIDRVFTLQGMGRIVTGTALAGSVRPEDTLMLYPPMKSVRVRSVQEHGRDVPVATGGHRVALALTGEGTRDLERGQVLSSLDNLTLSDAADCTIGFHAHFDFSLRTGDPVRVSVGTLEAMARIYLYDRDELKPGEEGFCQLRFDEPLLLFPMEQLILRRYSPVTTLGAGRVLIPAAPKRKRYDRAHVKRLENLVGGDADTILLGALAQVEPVKSTGALVRMTASDEVAVRERLEALVAAGRVERIAGYFVRSEGALEQEHHMVTQIERELEKTPLRMGVLPLSLYTAHFSHWDKTYFDAILDRAVDNGSILRLKRRMTLPGHRPAYTDKQAKERDRLIAYYKEAGRSPQSINGLIEALDLSAHHPMILENLVETGELVAIDEVLFMDSTTYGLIQSELIRTLEEKGGLTLGEAKDRMGTSRKVTIALLEHYDAIGLTTRVEGERRLNTNWSDA